MKVVESIALVIVATMLLTFSSLALALGGPLALDSRDLFVLSLLGAGLVFAVLAAGRLRRIHLMLKRATA